MSKYSQIPLKEVGQNTIVSGMQDTTDEPRHSIQLVSRRTGLTPAVIRAWERRYGAIVPDRSATHRRLYSDEEIERLILLRRVTLAGRRIGSVAALPTGQLRELVVEDERAAAKIPRREEAEAPAEAARYIEACLAALQRLDPADLETALRRAALELSPFHLMEHVLIPLLRLVGERWKDGSMQIRHEHLTTSLVRSLLEGLWSSSPRSATGPTIVVTTPAGQTHDLGALMVAIVAASKNWRVVYLGPDLPAEEIAEAVARCDAQALALSMIHPEYDSTVENELTRLRSLLASSVVVLAGGRASESYRGVIAEIGATHLAGLEALRAELQRLDRDVGRSSRA